MIPVRLCVCVGVQIKALFRKISLSEWKPNGRIKKSRLANLNVVTKLGKEPLWMLILIGEMWLENRIFSQTQ